MSKRWAHNEAMADRDLVVLAEEIISEMVSMLARLNAPNGSEAFTKKFDRFYAEGFGIANPVPQDDIVLSVLDEMEKGTTLQ